MRRRLLGVVALFAPTTLAVAADRQALQEAFVIQNPGVRILEDAGRVQRIYGAPFSFGNSPVESADLFRQLYAEMFGAAADELIAGNPRDGGVIQPVGYDPASSAYRFSLVYFRQEFAGVPVFESELRVLVMNEPGFPAVWASPYVRDLGEFELPAGPQLAADILEGAVDFEVGQMDRYSEGRRVIWAGVDDMTVEPRLAVEIVAERDADAGSGALPEKWRFLLDAQTGEVLFLENLILTAEVSGTVRGMATNGPGADACTAESAVPLPYAAVTVGSNTVYADVNGFYSHNPGASPVTVTSQIRGRWFRVQNTAGSNESIATPGNPPAAVDFMHNAANSSEFVRAQVNAYIQANIVRDYTLFYNPSYPTIANQQNWPVNVNINDTCNAFYDGVSINFFRSGGGCNNTAFDTVVHHEYGHHLVQVGGSGQGAYGEGMGDVMGVLIEDDSRLGVGFSGNCSAGIRNANNNCQYQTSGCSSCGSAIHSCGQLISGCVWSTRNALRVTNPTTYRDIVSALAIDSILLHTGSSISPSITIDWLTLDDNDGNIGNGTPHYAEIASGFGAHNMPAPALQLLQFQYPNGRPAMVNPAGGATLRVQVAPLVSQPQPASARFFYDIGGGFVQGAIQQISPNVYDATFPAAPCGQSVRYYFSAMTTDSAEMRDPANAPAESHASLAATGTTPVFTDNFETNSGWTAENLGATSGDWQRGIPVNDPGWEYDPASDSDGSGRCFLTQNQIGNTDVDDGAVRLNSPTFDMSAAGEYVIRYDYFLYLTNTSGGVDQLLVEASGNGAAGPWRVLTRHITNGNLAWRSNEVTSADLEAAGVPLTANMRLRFTANDGNAQSINESGLDAFQVIRVECSASCDPCDANCDGVIDAFDIEPFIATLGGAPGCSPCAGDANGDGTIDAFDVEPFINCLAP